MYNWFERKKFDYKQYFGKTLEDEQMLLDEEKSLELFSFLEKNVASYYLGGKAEHITYKDGNKYIEIKDVSFRKSAEKTEFYYDFIESKYKDLSVQQFFEWWIKGKICGKIDKINMLKFLN